MKISDILNHGRATTSFEFFPPKTDEGRVALLGAVERLQAVSPDFVSVTYGAGGTNRTQSFELCQDIRAAAPAVVMAHLTGICHTREEMSAIADKLWEAGIVNIMALRGDLPRDDLSRDDAYLAPNADGFEFGKDLIAFLKGRHDFCIGGGCYPEGHSETPDVAIGVDHIKQKIDAGCDFLVTQMFFDNECYFRFRDLLTRAGVNVPIVPGIMPVTRLTQIERFENQFGANLPATLRDDIRANSEDKAAIADIGVAFCVEQCEALLAGGAPGIHFYTLNLSRATVRVCEALRERGLGSAGSRARPVSS